MSDELEGALQELEAGGEAPVYLLWGEEFLVRKSAETLLGKPVPGGSADLDLVTIDAASPRELANELATPPMFGGRKFDDAYLCPCGGRRAVLAVVTNPRTARTAPRRPSTPASPACRCGASTARRRASRWARWCASRWTRHRAARAQGAAGARRGAEEGRAGEEGVGGAGVLAPAGARRRTIEGAKKPETRARRVAKALELLHGRK